MGRSTGRTTARRVDAERHLRSRAPSRRTPGPESGREAAAAFLAGEGAENDCEAADDDAHGTAGLVGYQCGDAAGDRTDSQTIFGVALLPPMTAGPSPHVHTREDEAVS